MVLDGIASRRNPNEGKLGPVGIIPLGSSNDLCKTLSIPLDPEGAAKTIARGWSTCIDLANVNDRYFVLAGLALFERQTYFLSQAFEQIQERYFPNHQPIPFHATEIRNGRELWRKVPHDVRQHVLKDVVQAIVSSPATGRLLFAAAVEKSREL